MSLGKWERKSDMSSWIENPSSHRNEILMLLDFTPASAFSIDGTAIS
jgi:hypothetical protein